MSPPVIDTSERNFEESIEAVLLGTPSTLPAGVSVAKKTGTPTGYVKRTPEQYDRERCLLTDDLFAFILNTQETKWKELIRQHGENQVRERFLKRLVKEIEERGTLDVLRKGVTDMGCKFDLVYFRPETSINEEHRQLYNANILSVVRQLKFSTKNENSLDVVLFVNGLPVITAELKNPLKGQRVTDAIKQYRQDRDPKEPLFLFKRCLAHFAVDPDMVYMTTQLRADRTHFLPFNKGRDKGAGNPDNPKGFKTDYLWKEVWQRDSLLEILNHFVELVDELDDDGKPTGKKKLIFPRYHQLDSVRRLVANAKANGAGQNYLIENSAGSGKSNSIAWLAHRLSCLAGADDKPVFDSIIVITDRRVLDWQLQQTVRSFERVKGVVTTIEKRKSTELTEALAAGKRLIVSTLQSFPGVAKKIVEMPGKRFAVIIDEAHSSQTGETTRNMREILVAPSLEAAEKEEGGASETEEDAINKAVEQSMKAHGRLKNVSFFAFTATPKPKTLELFGTKRPDGQFEPFSLYTMKQAIEEKFILDVLQNYTTFRVYFGLQKKIKGDPQYPKKKGIYLLKSYADLHPHRIDLKTSIMVEHFHENVASRIDKRAKAMVVTRSRLHAVRFKLAFDKLLKKSGYPYKAIVAFSGKVKDPDTGETFTEAGMNGFPDSQTALTFKLPEYRFLIVAEKFQTGFDQPLLHTMYVDKKLGGVNAVQTLSRLNRICPPSKEDTMVLDFANSADEIQKAFQPYYQSTLLTEPTDPNKLYDFKRVLEEFHIYAKTDVNAFAAVYFSKTGTQEKLRAMLDPVVTEYSKRTIEDREEFRAQVLNFVRLYAFLSHILTFKDVELEKLYQFLRLLYRLLKPPKRELPKEITEQINLEYDKLQRTSSGEIRLISQDGELKPISELGTGQQDQVAPLSEIVGYINDRYGTAFTTEDKVRHFAGDMERRLVEKNALREALNPKVNPSLETRRLAFDTFFDDTLEDMIETNFELYKKVNSDPALAELLRAVLFKKVGTAVEAA